VAKVFALYFLTFLYMTTLQVTLPLLANARLEWTETDIGRVFGLFGIVGLVVQGVLIGRLSRAFGARNLVVAGSLFAMAGLSLMASAHSSVALVAGLALMGIGLGVTNPVLSTLASEYAGAGRQGVVLGFAQSAGGLARTVGPIGAGVLYRRIDPGAPFVGGALAAMTALVLSLTIRASRSSR
jgi:MFS family permease